MKNKIIRNAISSLSQVIILTTVYFVLYKYLINLIGIEQLGIWSLILASTSILNISNLGFSSSVIKYVAKYTALNKPEKITEIIQTSLITVTIFSGLLLIFLAPFANLILNVIVPSNYLNLSKIILPYSLLSLWINIQSGIFTATLDGFQRIEIKNLILILGSIFYLILSIILVPEFGLLGVVYAQLIQVTLNLIFNIIVVKIVFPEYPLLKFQWSITTFKEIFRYSIKFQGIIIAQLLYDPITKSLLTKFGGLAATGHYEIASRLVIKTRELVVSSFQVLVPVYATQVEKDPTKIKTTYLLSFNYLIFLSIPLFILLILFTPLLSNLWLGSFDNQFVLFTLVLTCAWLINIFSVPAYFVYLGIGSLNWNILSHYTTGILNLFLCYLLGSLGGGLGVIIGWALALSIGSSIILFKINSSQNLTLTSFIGKENKIILMISFLQIITFSILYFYFHSINNYIYFNFLFIVLSITLLLYFYWSHPIKKDLIKNLKLFLNM